MVFCIEACAVLGVIYFQLHKTLYHHCVLGGLFHFIPLLCSYKNFSIAVDVLHA